MIISPAALQLMIAKEVSKALTTGKTTMISNGVQDMSQMLGVMGAIKPATDG